ncbi:polysaccharide deacetylase family protein [Edaphobacter sp.]|uniref:polysaccharide deacetylase family protein n=1 Tax=Edaphobacter sp. TaxID=1934404 RepID=UPI002DBC671D|nr:polysaccharide deacetylase family protein [Edaphobacter sp.]HEU5340728.1 polysaccharide deacetylase family protein [Edaphobacter sp.]
MAFEVNPIAEKPEQQTARRLHLLYHELRRGGSAYSYVVGTEAFERHVILYARLRERAAGLLPELTFDDGHRSNLEFAVPILQSRGLVARFFITVGWTGTRQGYMSWQELRDLQAAGQSIGAHGWSHTLLTHCTESDLDTELRQARLVLEDKLGTSITTMSLPGGRYNRRVLAACKDAGYTQVYSSIPRADNANAQEPLIGRLNIRGNMQEEWIASLFEPGSAVLAKLERSYRMKAAAKAMLGDKAYEKLWALVNRKEQDAE